MCGPGDGGHRSPRCRTIWTGFGLPANFQGFGSGLSNSHPIPVKMPLTTAIQRSMSRRTSMAARPMSFVDAERRERGEDVEQRRPRPARVVEERHVEEAERREEDRRRDRQRHPDAQRRPEAPPLVHVVDRHAVGVPYFANTSSTGVIVTASALMPSFRAPMTLSSSRSAFGFSPSYVIGENASETSVVLQALGVLRDDHDREVLRLRGAA